MTLPESTIELLKPKCFVRECKNRTVHLIRSKTGFRAARVVPEAEATDPEVMGDIIEVDNSNLRPATAQEVMMLLEFESFRDALKNSTGDLSYLNERRHDPSAQPLTLEEFLGRGREGNSNMNNFYMRFDPGLFPLYRITPLSLRFATENPELDEKLCELSIGGYPQSEDHKQLMYDAYKIMRSYDRVADWDIFY